MIAAGEVPLWATLLIGLAGGIIGTLATIGHERGAEFRTRMLTAADEFLQALTDAVNRVGDVRTLLREDGPPEGDVDEAFERLEEVLDELRIVLGRVDLLFGAETTTWDSASTAYDAITGSAQALRALRAGEAGAENLFNFYGGKLKAAADGFGADARHDVRGIGLRFPRWVAKTSRTAGYRASRRTAVWRHGLRLWLAGFRRR